MTTLEKTKLKTSDYSQADCEIGIVHVGYGAFHRAHQAVFIDTYMQDTGDTRWGIAAVNLRAPESAVFAKHAALNDGYVLKTMSAKGDEDYRVIRPHVKFSDWKTNATQAEELIAKPSVHVVTITVTESGYYLDDEGNLNVSDPIIKAELETNATDTIYAYLRAGLRRRIAANGGPITIMCCDNIRKNGKMLSKNFAAYLAAQNDTEMRDWLAENATFPCGMVDRITPKPTNNLSGEVETLFGRKNDPTVMAEDFIQWVIEDNFAGPMPDLASVGVTVTSDVDPFEETKIRILNGGHTCLTYLGALAGHNTFDQAMADPALYSHFIGYEVNEVLPALTLDLPFNKRTYLNKIEERFCNANIGDTIERICSDGYSKFPVFIRPTLLGCFKNGITPEFGITSIASWYVFSRRVALGQMDYNYFEPNMGQLTPLISDDDPTRFVMSEQLWGEIPQSYPAFQTLLKTKIKEVETTWPM